MFSVRPAASPYYLRRPRLLEQLPDAAGFVVWLEAPYGYGKSVLASHWAETLEREGWRVLWLSLAGSDARGAIAQRLTLPATAPWGIVNDELWSAQTVVVLEDLQGDEDLGPLLAQARGLVLLASRQALPYPELPKLRTAGRLVHLTSSDLAFEEHEAVQLFEDPTRGKEAWLVTRGWSLPLHFAALTGDLPQQASLLEGVRRSISASAWTELLFLAAADYLPRQAAVAATGDLARSGFVQSLADGYRLHALVAESVRNAHSNDVRATLAEQAKRLAPSQRAAAYERASQLAGLHELLVSGEGDLYQHAPEAFLRWHELAPASAEPERAAHVAMARLHLNRFDETVSDAAVLVNDVRLAKDVRARLAGTAIYALGAARRFDEVAAFTSAAAALLPDLAPTDAALLLQKLGALSFVTGDFAESERLFRASLAASKQAPPSIERTLAETKVRGNLYLIAWELHGNSEEPLAGQRELAANPDLDDTAYVTLHQNLAVSYALAGADEEAVAALRKATTRANAYAQLMIRGMLAYFERDLEAFPAIIAATRRWEAFELCERTSALWLRALRRTGDLRTALSLQPALQVGPFTKLELVWVHANNGDLATARALLEETRGAYAYREFLLHWHAAAYVLDRRQARLDELLALAISSEQLLTYTGIPLSTLPGDRPELARAYALDEVLASGWEDAIRLRAHEIPPLEVRLLGTVNVTRLGESVALTDRQRELMTLLALHVSREGVAEAMWPEADGKKQRNNLGVQLNLLRKLLEPWGVATYLNEAGLMHFESDVDELRSATEARDAERVLGLYRGPLAPGVEVQAVADERNALHEHVIEVLHAAALESASAPSEHEAAIRYLKRVLELEPLHEEALRALLALLAKLGRNREAQRHYARFRSLLLDEVGLEPHPTTSALLPDA